MKDRSVTFVAVAAVICIGILYFLNRDGAQRKYHWFENYRAESAQPYGASFISKLIASYRPESKFILNDNKPIKKILGEIKDHGNTDYIFVGENIFLDQENAFALARFIEAGGNAFIASLAPPQELLSSMYYWECGSPIEYEYHMAPSTNLNFYHPELKTRQGVQYAFRFGTKEVPYSWDYITDKVFCDSTKSLAALAYQDDGRVNFIKVKAGSGSLYLHTNPLVFTNYFLTDPEKVAYASGVFSHLDGNDIIWDEFSKIPFSGNNNAYNSPLYFILEQPSLKYAWWLLLLTVLIYVFFAAKRKQREIPVMESKSNTSLEFVNMISRLHYKNGNHLDMAHKKMKYFLYFVRSKYGIHAEKFRDEHIRRLSEKSKVNLPDVEVIFSRYYLIEEKFKNNIEANRLVDLYDSIDHFYKQSK